MVVPSAVAQSCTEAADSMAVRAFTVVVDSTAAGADKFHTSIHTRGSNGRQFALPAVFLYWGESADATQNFERH